MKVAVIVVHRNPWWNGLHRSKSENRPSTDGGLLKLFAARKSDEITIWSNSSHKVAVRVVKIGDDSVDLEATGRPLHRPGNLMDRITKVTLAKGEESMYDSGTMDAGFSYSILLREVSDVSEEERQDLEISENEKIAKMH